MGIAEDLADKLAADVIAYIDRTGDEDVATQIGQTLGDQSQTLQEAFVTSFRVQRAAIRAERLLAERIARHEGRALPPTPQPEAPAPSPPDAAPPPEDAEPSAPDASTPSDGPVADGVSPRRPSDETERPDAPKRKPPVPTVGTGRPKFG